MPLPEQVGVDEADGWSTLSLGDDGQNLAYKFRHGYSASFNSS